MFEQLKQTIKDNQEFLPPDLSLFWDDIAMVENLVPAQLFKPRMKGYTKKAARILWYKELTGRNVQSSKELWGKECLFVHEWLTGQIGQTGDKETDETLNQIEFTNWCLTNAQNILAFAQVVKSRELAKAKAKRQASKRVEVMPF